MYYTSYSKMWAVKASFHCTIHIAMCVYCLRSEPHEHCGTFDDAFTDAHGQLGHVHFSIIMTSLKCELTDNYQLINTGCYH